MWSDMVSSLRRWVRLALAVATLVTVAAPAALGPAMATLLDEMGGAHEHVCKCGMTPGKCGCPECDRAEQERLHARGHRVAPVLKSGCNQDPPALRFAGLPPALLPASGVLLPALRGDRAARPLPDSPALDHTLDPPTPPPRLASV